MCMPVQNRYKDRVIFIESSKISERLVGPVVQNTDYKINMEMPKWSINII